MKGVATIGKKGGTGKTTLAHLLALGACWKGVPTHFMHTDDRDPIKVNGRPYAYYDARDPENLKTLINMAVNSDGLFILDGGGNRTEFGLWVAEHMDLVLLPVTPDPEDVKVALRHMAMFEEHGFDNVRYILNCVPSNQFEKDFIKRYTAKLHEDKIICPVPEVKAVKVLREDDEERFATPASKVNNLARAVYTWVNHHLENMEENHRSKKAA